MDYLINHNYGSRSFTTRVKRDDWFKKKITLMGGGSDPRIKRQARPSGNKGNFLARVQRGLAISFCIVVMASAAYMSQAHSNVSIQKVDTPVQEENPNSTITNVNREQGFISRDMPRDYSEKDELDAHIKSLFVKYFGDDAKTMMAICKPENVYNKEPKGWKPKIIGDTHLTFWEKGQQYGMSVGICQIRIMPTRGITIKEMQDPEHNIQYAKYLSDEAAKRGLNKFSPWTCYKNGSYKNYLEN